MAHDVGDACVSNEDCRGNFRCEISSNTYFGRCFSPKLKLSVGDKCNPKAGRDKKQCVRTQHRGYFEELQCLKKNESYACQTVAGIFERCSAKKNIGCSGDHLTCNRWNVCVPHK